MQPLQRWALTLAASVVLATGCATGQTLRSTASFPQNDPKSQLALARLHEKRGEPDKAKQIYLSLMHRQAGGAEAVHRLANLCARQGEFHQAEQYYKQAFALNHESARLLNDIGYAYYMQHRLDEAQAALEEALAREPGNTQALNNLGLVLGSRGQLQKSYSMFARAGSEAEAHANLAFVHARRREFDQANKHIRTAVALDPRLRSATRSLLETAQREATRPSAAHAPVASTPPAREVETVSHEVRTLGESYSPPSGDSDRSTDGPAINASEEPSTDAGAAAHDVNRDGSAAVEPVAPAADSVAPVVEHTDPRPEVDAAEPAAPADSTAAGAASSKFEHAEIWTGASRTGYVEFALSPATQANEPIDTNAAAAVVTERADSSSGTEQPAADCRDVVLALAHALNDTDPRVRAAAALALGNICQQCKNDVANLLTRTNVGEPTASACPEHGHTASAPESPAQAEPQAFDAAQVAAPAPRVTDQAATEAASLAAEGSSGVSADASQHTTPPSTVSSQSLPPAPEPVVGATSAAKPVSGLTAALLASLPIAGVALAVFIRRSACLLR